MLKALQSRPKASLPVSSQVPTRHATTRRFGTNWFLSCVFSLGGALVEVPSPLPSSWLARVGPGKRGKTGGRCFLKGGVCAGLALRHSKLNHEMHLRRDCAIWVAAVLEKGCFTVQRALPFFCSALTRTPHFSFVSQCHTTAHNASI